MAFEKNILNEVHTVFLPVCKKSTGDSGQNLYKNVYKSLYWVLVDGNGGGRIEDEDDGNDFRTVGQHSIFFCPFSPFPPPFLQPFALFPLIISQYV